MMQGKVRCYNWADILALIFKDCGLATDTDQRQRGEVKYKCSTEFSPPRHEKDTCIEVVVYDKPASERLKEHVGD